MKLRFEKVAAEERPPSHPLPARLLPLSVGRLSHLIFWQIAPRHPGALPDPGHVGRRAERAVQRKLKGVFSSRPSTTVILNLASSPTRSIVSGKFS